MVLHFCSFKTLPVNLELCIFPAVQKELTIALILHKIARLIPSTAISASTKSRSPCWAFNEGSSGLVRVLKVALSHTVALD